MSARTPIAAGVSGEAPPHAGRSRPVAWACASCGRTSFPARGRCPSCWSVEGRETPVPRQGEIHSFTTVHVGPPDTDLPYTVAYVDAGPVRLFARVQGEPRVGARVRIVPVEAGDASPAPSFVVELEERSEGHG